ncbi:MAG: saccharopine dehydrogenase family protein [Candidatus Asgardarchaeia archaeon]
MEVGIFGAGVVGTSILYDILLDSRVSKVFVFDIDIDKLNALKKRFNTDKCEFIKADFQKDKINIENLDVAFGALPGSLGYKFMKWCISKGINLVDVSFMPEDPMTLNDSAKDSGVIIVPDAGIAPGLTNLLVGHFYFNVFDELQNVRIYVGALPEKPTPPLMHTITWSVPDFLDEYVRLARIIRDGLVAFLDPLSEIEKVTIPNVGEFEAFYSDGLRTLLQTLKIPNMAELTLRYNGHLAIMKTLDELDLLSDERISVNGCEVSPKELLSKVLEKYKSTTVSDKLVLLIEAKGTIMTSFESRSISMIANFSEKMNLSAIGTTTGFTASAIGRLILDKKIKEAGVMPPELIAKKQENVEFVISHLKTFENILFEGI